MHHVATAADDRSNAGTTLNAVHAATGGSRTDAQITGETLFRMRQQSMIGGTKAAAARRVQILVGREERFGRILGCQRYGALNLCLRMVEVTFILKLLSYILIYRQTLIIKQQLLNRACNKHAKHNKPHAQFRPPTSFSDSATDPNRIRADAAAVPSATSRRASDRCPAHRFPVPAAGNSLWLVSSRRNSF